MAARGKHPLQAARPDIDRYRNWLAQTIGPDAKPAANGRPRYAPATVARKLSAVRALYSYLSERRVLAGSPAAGVKGPQVRREPRGRAIGDEHVRVLLTAAVEHSDEAQAIVRLLLLNGLRVSEVCKANIEDLQREPGGGCSCAAKAASTRASRSTRAPSWPCSQLSGRAARGRCFAARTAGAHATTRPRPGWRTTGRLSAGS
jgi:integrase